MGKDEQMTETFDGSKILADLSGIPQDDVKKIWEVAKANVIKLHNCKRHHFETAVRPLALGMKLTCDVCGGVIGTTQLAEYIRGYEAAGGNPNDIWPGYRSL